MTTAPTATPLAWPELEALDTLQTDRINGPTNAQARLRLFGQTEADVRVTLYRDNHAWCPYCQKVWLWLEEKQIPYRIEKVTMFCYGTKEAWFKKKVPSGMLPALELDGQLITESDDILIALEQVFGPLTVSMRDPKAIPLRQLERLLFRAWCSWLCQPVRSARQEQFNREQFVAVVAKVEAALAATPGPYFLDEFSVVDLVFTPYVERMNASLFYYKGYSMRAENPGFAAWFDAMETRPTYRGTQSDFHTHVHDLPPQMGGCWENGEPQARANQQRVDQGPWLGLPDVGYEEPETPRMEALHRMLRHRNNIVRINPTEDAVIDEALRCALTYLMTGESCEPPQGSDSGLRYLRDRINVPRDMSIYAGKRLRAALEETAALAGDRQGPAIPVRNRYDQNPAEFVADRGTDDEKSLPFGLNWLKR
ncbi:glutathione S-transferase family protein [Leptolyngbya cf. ectocarpi LEGE 11479]|uniref:Glutathione S-transferase family protein n=1 Tax=Leptolyngbya cf. ectocarpi LEGE 11479 TaxID=1828722 RepID=A0A928X134_LEPEC|nr:glutathione S-transferase family protein [Leptolyngbya ectocarpi]MBE9065975.1 glutathione S-transferase family protein [Leptolyngbya cf. ectocarpi LEGE 11479]